MFASIIRTSLAALALGFGALCAQATDVGVSIQIGEPGFYGRIDIGNMPRPQLIYAEPVYVYRQPKVVYQPIYLRVPPGHEKNWKKHCSRYDACGRPVYFVRDGWYRDVYVPQYRRDHRHDHGRRDWDERRDDRRGDRDDRRGHGHGKGRDHERGEHRHGHRHD
jgi:hypothetical protein